MLKVEAKKTVSEKVGEKTGFLFAILLFVSIFLLVIRKFKILSISINNYFLTLVLIILLYSIIELLGGSIKRK